jgi:transcriptional regulator with XRE-family HTH domain
MTISRAIRRREVRRRLRQLRVAAKMDQQTAAAKLGLKQSDISRLENGSRRLDVVEVEDLARVYGRSLDFLATTKLGPKIIPIPEIVAVLENGATLRCDNRGKWTALCPNGLQNRASKRSSLGLLKQGILRQSREDESGTYYVLNSESRNLALT